MAEVHARKDVDAAQGEHKYGDVEFADETNNKYPIDTAEHVRAAWSYINKDANAAKYSHADVDKIKARIKQAATKHGIDIHD